MGRHTRVALAALGLAAALILGGTAPSSRATTSLDTSGLPQGSQPIALDPARFTTDIDNPYWPMTPGTRWTYRETDEQGRRLQVVVTASSRTKRIANGITARVIRDTVTRNGRIIEDTFDWYAQDADGNVWYLGEETAELDRGGNIASRAGSWESGVDGALAGLMVPAHPAVGMKYRQEYYAGQAEDNGEVLSTDEQAEVPAGHFTGVLLTKDTSALEPKPLEYKLYAPGIGPVLAVGISGGAGREELVKVERVSARAARSAGTTKLGSRYR
jgi:hypothetical protein